MKVCVIGAGIVGCASAYALASAGHEVILVDEAEGPARKTSFANGAQLSYSYVEPLASPSTLRSLPSMLLSASSPLTFRLRPDWRQWLWGLGFLAASTRRTALRGAGELLALAALSRETLDGWLAAEGWACDFARRGKLVLCPDEASLAHQRRQVEFQAGHGRDQQVLSRSGCVAREPALASYAGHFAGGVWTGDECVADPHALAAGMAKTVEKLGGQMRFGWRARDWVTRGTTAHKLVLQSVGDARMEDHIEADAFVLAAGPAVASLAAQLRAYVPVYPIKGYSITLPMRPGITGPQASVTDLSRKTVFAPLGGKLRIAARAEIVGHDLSIPQRCVDEMLDAVEAVFPGVADVSADPHAWAGLRPATPTSTPIVGRAGSWSNVWLNAGHGALGLTLAAGSAALLSRQIAAT
jgi:D-amino-acid dehydrogenase